MEMASPGAAVAGRFCPPATNQLIQAEIGHRPVVLNLANDTRLGMWLGFQKRVASSVAPG
jgi:hypothetical protein